MNDKKNERLVKKAVVEGLHQKLIIEECLFKTYTLTQGCSGIIATHSKVLSVYVLRTLAIYVTKSSG